MPTHSWASIKRPRSHDAIERLHTILGDEATVLVDSSGFVISGTHTHLTTPLLKVIVHRGQSVYSAQGTDLDEVTGQILIKILDYELLVGIALRP